MIRKQNIPVPFGQGLDQKTDPKQIAIGKFESLENTVFQKAGLLQKRNGYGSLPSLPDDSSSYLTTFNGDLTAIGTNLKAYINGTKTWVTKGNIQPVDLETLPLIRSNLNQVQCDSATSPNGLVCTVYTETGGTTSPQYKYAVADAITGQNVIAPTLLVATGSPRVFVLQYYFMIVYTNGTSLNYIAVRINNLTVTTQVTISSTYTPDSTVAFDGYVANNALYLAWNGSDGGGAIRMTYIDFNLVQHNTIVIAGYSATIISVTADLTQSTPVIYVSFYDRNSSDGYVMALTPQLVFVFAPFLFIDSEVLFNLTGSAQNGSYTLFAELENNYGYDSAIPTNYIVSSTITVRNGTVNSVFSSGTSTITVSSASGLTNGMYLVDNTTPTNLAIGTTFTHVGTTLTLSAPTVGNSAVSPGDALAAITLAAHGVIIRSVGLASKSFIIDGVIYFLAAYNSPYQPTYFLINGSISTQSAPIAIAKLAYSNGGGYLTLGLPSVAVSDTTASIAYLDKDLIEAANKTQNPLSSTPVYSQTGINLASFDLTTAGLITSEIGNNLNLTGGFVWAYDGYSLTEQNFHLWPDSVEATWLEDSTVTPTGTVATGSTIITAMSSVSGVAPGMTITGTAIPANTTVVSVGTTTIVISAAATGNHSSETLTIAGHVASKPDGSTTTDAYFYQVTYEWSDNQGNVFRSAPSIPVAVTTTGTSTTGSITLNIPTLRITYKTANPVKIVVYRWSVAHQTYYQVTSITTPLLNKLTVDYVTFVDVYTDDQILGNNIIYTTGGVVENIGPPAANAFTLYKSRLFLVDSEDRNLLWYSKQVIENTPVEMSDLFTIYIAPTTSSASNTGPITALSTMDDKLIIFKNDAIYYITGTGPDNTGANDDFSEPVFITSTVGCANKSSIVFMPQGLMFQSDKGIWLLGRDLSTSYIGSPVNDFNRYPVNSAINIPGANQVRFTLSSGITLMYDYYFNQWGTFVNVPAVSSCIYQGVHTYINSFGAAFQETPGVYLDGSSPVLMKFTTGWINPAGLQGYLRSYAFYLLGQYLSPHKLQVAIAYDYNSSPTQTTSISPDNYSPAYGGSSPYGAGSPYGGIGDLEQWRIFLQRQRCMAFQISLSEAYDPSFGIAAGAGLTLSGLNLLVGIKSGWNTVSAANSVG